MSLGQRVACMLPGRRLRRLPAIRLVADESRVLRRRRRADCLRLARCEDEWIAAHGEAQAKCSQQCRGVR